MQTRDGIPDDITPRYSNRNLEADEPKPFPAAMRMAAVVAAWVVPGAGHILLGRFGRGILFFVVLVGAFILGLGLHGRLYWPVASDSPSFLHYDLITVLWFFAQIGSGLCYIVSYLLGFGTSPQPAASTFEYGNTFMFLAGLLNYLVMHDAFDIAAGRKR